MNPRRRSAPELQKSCSPRGDDPDGRWGDTVRPRLLPPGRTPPPRGGQAAPRARVDDPRGWRGTQPQPLLPARVGMTPDRWRSGCSRRLRGWTPSTGICWRGNPLFPAPVGMDLTWTYSPMQLTSCSPRVRGWSRRERRPGRVGGLHPRVRGDAPECCLKDPGQSALLPARAGMVPDAVTGRYGLASAPRTRGWCLMTALRPSAKAPLPVLARMPPAHWCDCLSLVCFPHAWG